MRGKEEEMVRTFGPEPTILFRATRTELLVQPQRATRGNLACTTVSQRTEHPEKCPHRDWRLLQLAGKP
jgi:hypothetical protein